MNLNPETPRDGDFGTSLLITCWVLAGIAFIIVALRLIARATTTGRLGADDYLMTFSFLSSLVSSALITVAVRWGLGKHLRDLDPEHQVQAVKYDFIEQPFLVMSPCFGRISFALFLVRILRKDFRRRRILYIIVASQLVINVTTAVVILAQCQPVRARWDPTVQGHCWSPNVQLYCSYFQGSWNTLTDLILAVFPASFLWDLNVPLRKRVGLILIMSLGVFVMAASIVKTIQLKSLAATTDYTYATAILFLWATIEMNFVIIAASIPVSVPVYRWAIKQLQNYRKTIESWPMFSGFKRTSTTESGDSSRLVPGSSTKIIGKKSAEDYALPAYPPSGIMKSTIVEVDHYSPNGSESTQATGPLPIGQGISSSLPAKGPENVV